MSEVFSEDRVTSNILQSPKSFLTRPRLEKLAHRRRKALIGVPILLVIAVAVWNFSWNNKALPAKLVSVEQGPISAWLSATGKIVSRREVILSASATGQLVSVAVKEGDKVAQGQVLAVLDDRETRTLISKAETNLQRAEQEAQQAARTLERQRRLWEAGGDSRQAMEDAEAQWQAATTRQTVANDELRLARINLDKMRITAPFAGLVTAKSAQIGQWVGPGGALFTLADPNQREIEAKVDASESGEIALEQEAVITSDAFPGRQWTEKIVRLASAINRENTADTFNIRLSLGSDAPPLRLGSQVDVKIRTAFKSNALKLPSAALINNNGKTAVAVIQNGRIHFIPVITGIEDLTHTEIVQGLQAGRQVILADVKTLREGDRVSPLTETR